MSEQEFQKLDTELGTVYLPKTGMKYEETVTLGFSNFMNAARITVIGVDLV